MERFVDFITNPSWWSVILSAVSAIAVIVIAVVQIKLQIQQTKLQKRQSEAQEYDVYRKLYILINNTELEVQDFLHNTINALWEPWYTNDKEFLKNKLIRYKELKQDLLDKYIDYELKFSKESFNKNWYINILTIMIRITKQIIIALERGDIAFIAETHTIECRNEEQDDAYAYEIAKLHKVDVSRRVLLVNLKLFVREKRKHCGSDKFLEMIKKRCKID